MAAGSGAERSLRLFLALELEEDTRRALARWTAAAVAGRDELRAVPADALHVTLAFLGATPRERAPELWAAAAAAAAGHRAPELTPIAVKGVPPRRPRLMALDLEDEGGLAGALHEAVASALRREAPHWAEHRPLWPHVTFARARRGARMGPLQVAPPKPAPFSTPSIALYRSHRSPRGARYELLERLELRR